MNLQTFMLALAVGVAPPAARAADSPPVQVMVVGVFHMANPGHDLHDIKADDVLAPGRQGEIAALTAGLARFKPTRVGVEWPADLAAERYAQYLAGTLPPSRNEVVQLGFRLARTSGAGVDGLDADGDFPYERLKNFAETRSFKALLDAQNAAVQRDVDDEARGLAQGGIAADLRRLNSPDQLARDQGFYRTMLRIGAGDDQPGVDLVAAWYHRNLQICANLLQASKPGDRVVIFFGAGHGFLLRQCVAETPGYKLVEANAYLPR